MKGIFADTRPEIPSNMDTLTIRRLYLAALLSITTAIIGCGESQASSELNSDQTSALIFEDGERQSDLLTTGVVGDTSHSWFCTFTSAGQYVDRVALSLWSNGSGLLDDAVIEWSATGDGAIIESVGARHDLADIEFSARLTLSDMFTASLGGGHAIACDWVGSPRFPVFNDDIGVNDSFFSAGDVDSIDVMLDTGDLEESEDFWLCRTDNAAGQTLEYSIRFSDLGADRDGESLEWVVRANDSIEIFGQSEFEVWTQIIFRNYLKPDLGLGFTALVNNAEEVDCEWGGEDRASFY